MRAIHVAVKTVRDFIVWISPYINFSQIFSSLFPLSGILQQFVPSAGALGIWKYMGWVMEADMVQSKAGLS